MQMLTGPPEYARCARSSGSESFQVLQKRRVAAQILDLPEVLMIQSLQHGEVMNPLLSLSYLDATRPMRLPLNQTDPFT